MYLLEDDSGRLVLRFDGDMIPSRLLVTGVSVAVLGRENEAGEFCVQDLCFAGLDAARPASKPRPMADSYLALVSGLRFGAPTALPFDLFADFVTGLNPCFVRVLRRAPLTAARAAWPRRSSASCWSATSSTRRRASMRT